MSPDDPQSADSVERTGILSESIPPQLAPPAGAGNAESNAEPSAGQNAPRVRIGTQREGQGPPPAATPQPVVSPPKAIDEDAAPRPARPVVREKVPLPNLRAGLSDDLEAEFIAALGESSVEKLLNASPGVAGIEIEPETRVQARVIGVQRDDLFLDLGGRRQGAISIRAFPGQLPEPGAIIEVVVQRFDSVEGLYAVSLPGGAVDVGDWSDIAEGLVVEARVTGHNKGGLECEVNHIRGFIPAGQVAIYRVEDLSQLVGQKMACVVTEANRERRNLVLSRRAVLERESAESKQRLLAELEPGQTREGTVRSLQEFGAFVDLGGIDGLIHISQLSWDRLKHANEALELGQKVKVRVQKIDPASGRISLAFRDLSESPWTHAATKYAAHSRVHGVVSRLTEFGAFVRLEPGIEGLIHISELAHKRVFRAGDVVQEGQDVEVLVLSVDVERQRIGLSLKALAARPADEERKQAKAEEEEAAAELVAPTYQPKRKSPLKGGVGRSTGGEQFGLRW